MTNAPAVPDNAMREDCVLTFATFMDESTIRENGDVDRAEFPYNS